ncbi:hypothetical protein [Flavobacterium sp.]|jgi:hypothetical protein|uniref:hypothetical protein n=1 Tax=Flavobacterium sp. TaxID=239 RepID=UPI003F6961A4
MKPNCKKLLPFYLFLISISSFANPEDPPADPEASINNNILILAVVGLIFAAFAVKNKLNKVTN